MKRIYLDACMVIDLVEGAPRQQALLVQYLVGQWIYSSELVRLESRIKALRENRQDFLKAYGDYFQQCEIVPFDRAVFDKATELRVLHRLKTPDALHLAAALQAGCEEFLTNDLHLANAASGRIRVLDWYTLETLSPSQTGP